MVTIEKPKFILEYLFDVTPTFPTSYQIGAGYHRTILEDNSHIDEASWYDLA